MSSEQFERNKRNVLAFYDLMFNQCKPAEAIERHVADRYNGKIVEHWDVLQVVPAKTASGNPMF